MPEWIAVICLGVIEGLTEFLPISSTGHLLLAQYWLPRQSETFNTVIQCGAVLAVVVVFAERVKQLFWQWRERVSQDYLFKLTAAFAITGAGGLLLKKFGFKLPETVAPVASALLLGGVLFVLIEQWLRDRPLGNVITWRAALAMGLAQLLAAAFPGTSRSGATILAALLLGISRPAAIEFSFLLGIPTLLSAGGLQIYSAFREPESAPINWGMLLLGLAVSGVVAFGAVKWLLRYVQTHTFVAFGWYRIAMGLVILLLVR